jgi:DNA repair exonuclease SbcCD nuclease subunit
MECPLPRHVRLETAADPIKKDEPSDLENCPICFEPFSTSNNHKIVSLKCGHLFGRGCVDKWLALNTSRACPECNALINPNDIRPLFTRNVRAVDTAKLDELTNKMKELVGEVTELKDDNASLRARIAKKNEILDRVPKERANEQRLQDQLLRENLKHSEEVAQLKENLKKFRSKVNSLYSRNNHLYKTIQSLKCDLGKTTAVAKDKPELE